MKSRRLVAAMGVTLAATTCVGLFTLRPGTGTQATAETSSLPVAATPSQKPSSGANPDAGKPAAVVEAEHQQQWEAFQARYASWVTSAEVRALDPRSLPRGELAASWPPGPPSLNVAVKNAGQIVSGQVVDVEFQPDLSTLVTMDVTATAKGSPVTQAKFVQGGGLMPTEDWSGAKLVEGAAEPLLLRGDRAVVFLETIPTNKGDRVTIQPWSGLYKVTDGRITPVEGNNFGSTLRGKPEGEFLETVRRTDRSG